MPKLISINVLWMEVIGIQISMIPEIRSNFLIPNQIPKRSKSAPHETKKVLPIKKHFSYGGKCLHSSSDTFLFAYWVQCDRKGSSVPVRHSPFGLQWRRMLSFIFRCLPARLMGSVRLEKVHQSPSAKNVPPARFLNADLRAQHSPFGLLINNSEHPWWVSRIIYDGECFRSSFEPFLLAWWVQCGWKRFIIPRPLKTCPRHVFFTRTFESSILLLAYWLK